MSVPPERDQALRAFGKTHVGGDVSHDASAQRKISCSLVQARSGEGDVTYDLPNRGVRV